MNCEKCGATCEVYDANNLDKPLRCSNDCSENRKSINQREIPKLGKRRYISGLDT